MSGDEILVGAPQDSGHPEAEQPNSFGAAFTSAKVRRSVPQTVRVCVVVALITAN